VIIINDTLARRFWPGENPVGGRLALGQSQNPSRVFEIVGVVADMKRLALSAAERPEIYFPFIQRPVSRMDVLVRAKGSPGALASAVKAQLWSVDKDLPATYLSTMDHLISESLSRPRFDAMLLAAFAGLALLLAMVGLYGVIAYGVSQRTQEIGVRMALGAQRADILRLVLSQGVLLTAAGVVAGLAISLAMTRAISGLLYGVSAFDPITYAAVTLLITLVAMLACYIPARRAMRVDPMIALRYE
jgi:putative ABC transport system permease protein